MAEDLGFDETRGGSLVVSAALVGAAVGALLAGQFADRVGPKKALLLNNSSLIVGCILIAWAPGGIWAAILGMQPFLMIPCSLSQLPHPTFLGNQNTDFYSAHGFHSLFLHFASHA